jgi:hypothetical protein
MRVLRASTVAIAVAMLGIAVSGASAQDADRKVAGGGVTVKGWQGKVDAASAAKQGLTINDSKFAQEANDLHVTTGAAASYWNPANTASGDYTVKATFKEAKQTYTHPHPFGIFIGGSKLDTDQQNLLYCVAYRDGTYLVRGFFGGAVTTIAKKAPNEAVAKAASADAPVTQEIAWTVKGSRAECSVNGTVVAGFDKSEIVGPGKLESTDGVYGLRVAHNSDVVVSGLRKN